MLWIGDFAEDVICEGELFDEDEFFTEEELAELDREVEGFSEEEIEEESAKISSELPTLDFLWVESEDIREVLFAD